MFNVISLTRLIARDQTLRRQMMFYIVLADLGMLFLGSTLFADYLQHDHPLLFVVYWLGCAWLTLTIVLMAAFDLIMVRAAARAERKKMEAKYLAELQRGGHDEETRQS